MDSFGSMRSSVLRFAGIERGSGPLLSWTQILEMGKKRSANPVEWRVTEKESGTDAFRVPEKITQVQQRRLPLCPLHLIFFFSQKKNDPARLFFKCKAIDTRLHFKAIERSRPPAIARKPRTASFEKMEKTRTLPEKGVCVCFAPDFFERKEHFI